MTLTQAIEQFPTKAVNLIFVHGIGDCMMFMPTVEALEKKYPNIKFKVLTIKKQIELFQYSLIEAGEFKRTQILDQHNNMYIENDELFFDVRFPMSEGTNLTKNEFSCLKEIGDITPIEGYRNEEELNSTIIGMHFQNTCLPNGANPTRDQAKQIWDAVKEAGYIPLEVHFHHDFHNPVNKQFDFVDFTTRKMECNIHNLTTVIESCHRFIGVNSGPYFVALRFLGINNTMMIEKDYLIKNVVKTPCPVLNIKNGINMDILNDFIR